MARGSKRSTRLIDLAEYLVAKRRPVQVKALAEHYGLHRSTIHRMLVEIETELDTPVEREPDGRAWIDPDKYQFSIRLTLNETMAVFLAARLLARYSDKPNPYAVKALRGLSRALGKTAPRIAGHIARTSDKLDRPLNDAAQEHLRALEALTRAWAEGTRVRLFTRERPEVERLFEPYFIEPSAVGYSSYVIGYDHLRGEVRTFKIERLLRAVPTLDTYTIPATFDPYAKLAGAWGVNWGKDGEATRVTLRFAPGRAADRVRETHWHESQVIEDAPDGGCVLAITVGSTQEMKPWIRQWGPDCEVLAPPGLRREIAEEMRRAGENYTDL
jgi:predicted DNA-binding transcriptional regulator YafY